MSLFEQVFSLFFCVIFGFGYCLLFYKFKFYLVLSKYKFFYNFIFHLIFSCLFFLGLIKINDGILHLYFLLFFLLGQGVFKISFGFWKCQM